MNGRKISLIAMASLLGLSQAQAKGPNVVIILADDLGYGDISALNPQSKIRTPNIDRLVMRGLTFTDAHSCSAVSSPSRYGLLTGRYAFRSTLKDGVLNGYAAVLGQGYNEPDPNSKPLITEDRKTIADMFKSSGYNTACIGKWHVGWNWAFKEGTNEIDYSKPITNGPLDNGFDYYYGLAASLDIPPYVYVENNMPTAIPDRMHEAVSGPAFSRAGVQSPDFDFQDCLPNLIRRASDYIDSQKDEENPFFLYLPLTAPHTPILPSKEFRGKSGLNEYGDFVMMVDSMVGKIVAALKKAELWENTIFIFVSDNGCAPGKNTKWDEMISKGHSPSYIYRGAKRDIWDGGHRIPLVISWGEHFRNFQDPTLVCLTDFYATFAQITGYTIGDNEAEDSYSFLPSMVALGENQRKDIVHQSSDGSLSIREGKWKLAFCPGSGGNATKEEKESWKNMVQFQLYDMEKDPGETTNLAGKHKKMVRKMADKLVGYIEAGRSTPGNASSNDPVSEWNQTKLVYEMSSGK